ncbi:unnamed protein product [Closterium sp. NIES-53]
MPRAQRESGHKVKVIRTDNGGEYIGADFEAVLKKKGIQHQLTVPYNPQQNGVAECFNRTLQEGARNLLGCAGLPDPFWVTALRQVALVKNRVLATVGDKQWVPYTKWYGSAPAVNMLRAYGCMVVFHTRQQLTVSRDVKFLESLYYKEWKQQQQKLPTTPLIIEADEVQRPLRQVQVTVSEEEISGVTEDGGEPEVEEQQQQQQQDAPQGAARPADRPRRDVRPHNRLTYPIPLIPACSFQHTLRVLLHVAAHRDYELHSLDFITAFLQGSLHEEIWLRRPLGFTGTFPPGTQWSLRRSVYGLCQAPREWHDTLRTTLAALGFVPSTADPSLFLRTNTSLPPFYILVYIDDLVFATADTAGLAHVKSELQKRHTCTDLGELRSYLGLQITRDRARRTITLTQSHMVQQVLQRFGFTYSLPQATPLSTRHSLSALPSDESVESSGPYPELVGCLMYLMNCTRPDLAYPLSILARYVAPGRHRPEHMAAAKRVLRYLCSTSGMGLVLGGRSPVVLIGHADASWADDQATQRSSQGYTFSLGSGSVSWRATRSSSVLGSSCEAEIYAGAMAAQELRWLTYLLTDLGEPPRSPPVLTKHIALRYFLARELQQRGQLRLAYVASEANTADVFTKALAPCDHQRFCTQLGLVSVLPHFLTS